MILVVHSSYHINNFSVPRFGLTKYFNMGVLSKAWPKVPNVSCSRRLIIAFSMKPKNFKFKSVQIGKLKDASLCHPISELPIPAENRSCFHKSTRGWLLQ